jgi:hypothetical protein
VGLDQAPDGSARRSGITTIIDRRYPFEQITEAHSYVDTGPKKGNVIVTLEHDD